MVYGDLHNTINVTTLEKCRSEKHKNKAVSFLKVELLINRHDQNEKGQAERKNLIIRKKTRGSRQR